MSVQIPREMANEGHRPKRGSTEDPKIFQRLPENPWAGLKAASICGRGRADKKQKNELCHEGDE